MQHIYLPNV